jgi:hypothetical protein
MGRFDAADGESIPYSDKRPDRCLPLAGPRFVLPGEVEPRACGADPDMPPASDSAHWKRQVRRGYEDLKR